ncbi:MAG: transketolase C-terminal domain-containing protein, partial [Alphaproteobacteria bacterium]
AEVDLAAPPIPFGQARIARDGAHATVVALSAMVDEALAAADALAARGVSVEVVDPRTVAPLDVETIVRSVQKTKRLVVAHDAHKTAGPGAEIAAVVTERTFDHLVAPVERVAALDVPIPSGPLVSEVYPDRHSIVRAVERVLVRGGARR